MGFYQRLLGGAARWGVYAFLLACMTGAATFFYARGPSPIRPEFLALGGLLVVVLWRRSTDPRASFPDVALPVIAAFGLLTIARLLGGFNTGAVWEGFGKEVFRPLLSFLVVVLAAEMAGIPFIRTNLRRIFVAALVLYLASLSIDLIRPGTFTKFFARPAGFAINANMAGQVIIMFALLSVRWRRCKALDGLIWTAAGIGVAITLSRSALLNYAICLAAYAVVLHWPRIRRNPAPIIAIALLLPLCLYGAASAMVWAAENMDLPTASVNRIVSMALLFSGDLDAAAGDSRAILFDHYLTAVSAHPLAGYGPGFFTSGETGAHNMALQLWADAGLLAPAAFVLFLCWTAWHFGSTNKAASAVTLSIAIFSAFSHNLLDNVTFLLIWGLMPGLRLGLTERSESPTDPARSRTAGSEPAPSQRGSPAPPVQQSARRCG